MLRCAIFTWVQVPPARPAKSCELIPFQPEREEICPFSRTGRIGSIGSWCVTWPCYVSRCHMTKLWVTWPSYVSRCHMTKLCVTWPSYAWSYKTWQKGCSMMRFVLQPWTAKIYDSLCMCEDFGRALFAQRLWTSFILQRFWTSFISAKNKESLYFCQDFVLTLWVQNCGLSLCANIDALCVRFMRASVVRGPALVRKGLWTKVCRCYELALCAQSLWTSFMCAKIMYQPCVS